jgi:hypothetical protein
MNEFSRQKLAREGEVMQLCHEGDALISAEAMIHEIVVVHLSSVPSRLR